MSRSFTRIGIGMLCGTFVLAAAGLGRAQSTQDKPKETTVVVQDDTTPKVKKGTKVVEDASVTTAVKSRLMTDKIARGTSIDVKTDKGVVTLAGAVPSAADKARIGRLVAKTTGVEKVDNGLTVDPSVVVK